MNVQVHVSLRPALVVCLYAGESQVSVFWPLTSHHTEPRFAGKLKAAFARFGEFFVSRLARPEETHQAGGEDGDDLFTALRGRNFGGDCRWADLRGSNLSGAALVHTDFHKADLSGAVFERADLTMGNLEDANVTSARFAEAVFDRTRLLNTDFRSATGLCACIHRGPSLLDRDTLLVSPELPREFLQGCGLFIPYRATVYRVLVGSPSDVAEERLLARNACTDHRDIWEVFLDTADTFFAGRRFSYHGHIGGSVDQELQGLPNDLLVVHHQNADLRHAFWAEHQRG